MNTFGQEVKEKPDFPTKNIQELRIELINEELEELKEAMADVDKVDAGAYGYKAAAPRARRQ